MYVYIFIYIYIFVYIYLNIYIYIYISGFENRSFLSFLGFPQGQIWPGETLILMPAFPPFPRGKLYIFYLSLILLIFYLGETLIFQIVAGGNSKKNKGFPKNVGKTLKISLISKPNINIYIYKLGFEISEILRVSSKFWGLLLFFLEFLPVTI